MEPRTYLDHYRGCHHYDGAPIELGRSGPAIFQKGKDARSGAPVLLTLLPIDKVEEGERPAFTDRARATLQLDHPSIAKIVAFGEEHGEYVFVSEFPQGDTLQAWVAEHGPMPPDAVLRVALQVIGALNAASFVGLTHRAIEPANLMIVPGQTAEGGWPAVKLVNFGLSALQRDPAPSEFASPEQVDTGRSNFPSEVYSLGATMCYLLTGVFYSAEPRSFQTKRFAKPLRRLIAPMLSQEPNERPQDITVCEESLRKCLQTVERRQRLASTMGIPFAAVQAKTLRKRARLRAGLAEAAVAAPTPIVASLSDEPPMPVGAASALEEPLPVEVYPAKVEPDVTERRSFLPRSPLAWAAIILFLLGLAAVTLPAPVAFLTARSRDKDAQIGIPVGVPQSSPSESVPAQPAVSSTAAPNAVAQVAPSPAQQPTVGTPAPPSIVSVPPPGPADDTTKPEPSASVSTAPMVAANNVKQAGPRQESVRADTTEAEPPATGPQTIWDRAGGTNRKIKVERANDASENRPNSKATAKVDADEKDNSDNSDENDESSNMRKSTRTGRVVENSDQHPNSSVARHNNRAAADEDEDTGRSPGTSRNSGKTVRARYIGMTPDGNLMLRMPSGEIAIVSPRNARLTVPHHRTRRTVTQPRVYYPSQPQPYYYDPYR